MNTTTNLEGGCLVTNHTDLEFQQRGPLSWSRVAGPSEGTKKLSQFYFKLEPGSSGNISFEDSELVLYLTAGHCRINIAGRNFQVDKGCGVHIRTGETFSLQNDSDSGVCFTATVCPGSEAFDFLPNCVNNFDDRFPERVIDAQQSERQATGDRFYRLLVGPQTGSEKVTQFIGMIPRSKAPEHFHLYEETIYILSGSGHMWAGDTHTPVREGSMIFLPAKQRHCLECTDPAGMLLVGSFYPAGSPAVNYATEG
ncbi:MAG: cupin domain-containing protein [Xanthomonadales bacterium]|nr:cupin domain-containing protein [Xanthomonadales bacterium]